MFGSILPPGLLEENLSPGAFRVDHIAIAVRDLPSALTFYRDVLGMPVSGIERVESQEVDVAFVGEDPGRIELICPFKQDTPVARFIEKRGEGVHHIAVRVANLPATLTELKAKGVVLIDSEPRHGSHGSQIAFVHPKSARGILLELVQVPDLE